MTDSRQDFLTRWSRLKRRSEPAHRGRVSPVHSAEQAEEQAEEQDRTEGGSPSASVAPPPLKEVAAGETGPLPQPPAAPEDQPSEALDLPPLENLDKDSDFSVFMQQGVPEELRRLALRKLWRLIPSFPDGLDDYDEDYSIVALVAEKVSGLSTGAQGISGPAREAAQGEPEEALGEPEEAAPEAAPLAAHDAAAGAEPVPGAAGEDDVGEDDVEAADTTDVSHDSRDRDAAAAGPPEGPGKA